MPQTLYVCHVNTQRACLVNVVVICPKKRKTKNTLYILRIKA